MLPSIRKILNNATLQFISARTAGTKGSHQKWKRAYLKDLFNRRVMLGPDPMISRSAQDNWNYSSEISALSHRLKIPEIDANQIVQALTNESFFGRKDVDVGASHAQPSNEEEITNNSINQELAEKGVSIFQQILLVYLRAHWPSAPEEFIMAVANRMASPTNLTELANHLGLQHVVRTGEFPPNESTLQMALYSLIAIMDATKARNFIRIFVLPQLLNVPLEDVLPFKDPFRILQDYMQKWKKIDDLEPRLINSGGLSTATPFCEIAIFANKSEIVGQSFGEFPWVALDLASQNALLKLWNVMDVPRVFPFKFDDIYSARFEKAQSPNHNLEDVCRESTNISLYTQEELMQDPIDPAEMAQQYFTNVKAQVGFPHRKRLRHTFHQGSIQRHSLRRLVKPEPHNI